MLRERNQSPLRWVMIKLIAPYNKLSWLRQAQKCYKADDGTTAAVAAWDALPGNIHSLLQHLQQQHKINRIGLSTISISYNPRPPQGKKNWAKLQPWFALPIHWLYCLLSASQTDLLRSLSTFSDWFASLGPDSVAGAGAAGPSLPPDVAAPVLWIGGAASEIGQTRGWSLYYWWRIPNFPSVTENVIHFKRLQN